MVFCLSLKKGITLWRQKKNLCDVFGDEAGTARTYQKRLMKFFFENEPRSGRPPDVSDEVLHCTIRTNLPLTSIEVGFKLGIHQTTGLENVKRLGFVPKLCV
ncbi:histone-lysine N-methyltransferase SETMAR [Trichonephila clavipes]|nr:histone-lysine N-methyltransferase SETMAR [Trichonephila clavipes]